MPLPHHSFMPLHYAPAQAWVVFEKAEDARKAMEAMQGFPFFDKPIVSSKGHECCAAACSCRAEVRRCCVTRAAVLSGTTQAAARSRCIRVAWCCRPPMCPTNHLFCPPPAPHAAHLAGQDQERRGGQAGRHLPRAAKGGAAQEGGGGRCGLRQTGCVLRATAQLVRALCTHRLPHARLPHATPCLLCHPCYQPLTRSNTPCHALQRRQRRKRRRPQQQHQRRRQRQQQRRRRLRAAPTASCLWRTCRTAPQT